MPNHILLKIQFGVQLTNSQSNHHFRTSLLPPHPIYFIFLPHQCKSLPHQKSSSWVFTFPSCLSRSHSTYLMPNQILLKIQFGVQLTNSQSSCQRFHTFSTHTRPPPSPPSPPLSSYFIFLPHLYRSRLLIPDLPQIVSVLWSLHQTWRTIYRTVHSWSSRIFASIVLVVLAANKEKILLQWT